MTDTYRKDPFRKEYKKLSDKPSKLITELKEAFEQLEKLMNRVMIREMSIALANLKRSAMWATKAVDLWDEDEKK